MLPMTNLKHYITAMTALGMPTSKDNGDLRHIQHLLDDNKIDEVNIAGSGKVYDTYDVLGDYGIVECSSSLRAYGFYIPDGQKVYVANTYRAFLDSLIFKLKSFQSISLLNIEEWFYTQDEKYILLQKFFEILPQLSLSSKEKQELLAWLKRQNLPILEGIFK